jgi:phosphatidylcholine synthase
MGLPAQRVAGFGVHLLTASGAALGLLAIDSTAGGRIRDALIFMFAAVVVDGVDGTLARRLRVRETVPWIDGDLLDNLVDYLNYTIVPAFLIHRTGLLPHSLSWPAVGSICVASAFQFVHRGAKSEEHGFRGFPSYWNVVALYLLLGGLSPWINLVIVVGLIVLSFAPVYWVYPSRATRFRRLTVVGAVAWALVLVAILALYPDVPGWIVLLSLAYVALYAALGSRGSPSKRESRACSSAIRSTPNSR